MYARGGTRVTTYMIERYLELADFINMVILKVHKEKSSKAMPPEILDRDEIDILLEARDHLLPLEEATRHASTEKLATIRLYISIIYGLKVGIDKLVTATALGFNIKHQLLAELEKICIYRVSASPCCRDAARSTVQKSCLQKWPGRQHRRICHQQKNPE